jgi:ABC-type nitrate/sulfonate/bicarbonate transport system substrate-binding protein
MTSQLHVGFIPLVDAAALIVAVDKGFTAAEGLDVTLVREVSWSNIRDKLNIGMFDAAHLLAPVAIASSLGIGHVKVPIAAPFNAESLAGGQIDAFCVGAPWNSIAVDRGVGHILHFVADVLVRAAEKVLAVRQSWAERHPETVAALVRAAQRGADFVEQNRAEAARILAAPERIGVEAEIIQRSLDGRLKISPDGILRECGHYLMIGREGAARPEPVQAGWLYAQMVRWGQASVDVDALKAAMAVFRPDLYDAALGRGGAPAASPLGAFAGPVFDPVDLGGYLGSFAVARRSR